jgi:hypothetical protein
MIQCLLARDCWLMLARGGAFIAGGSNSHVCLLHNAAWASFQHGDLGVQEILTQWLWAPCVSASSYQGKSSINFQVLHSKDIQDHLHTIQLLKVSQDCTSPREGKLLHFWMEAVGTL